MILAQRLTDWREQPTRDGAIAIANDLTSLGEVAGERKPELARELYQAIGHRFSGDADVVLALGRALLAHGELKLALTRFVEGARLQPSARNVHLLGETLLRIGDAERAVRAFERALGLSESETGADKGRATTEGWLASARALEPLQRLEGREAVAARVERARAHLAQIRADDSDAEEPTIAVARPVLDLAAIAAVDSAESGMRALPAAVAEPFSFEESEADALVDAIDDLPTTETGPPVREAIDDPGTFEMGLDELARATAREAVEEASTDEERTELARPRVELPPSWSEPGSREPPRAIAAAPVARAPASVRSQRRVTTGMHQLKRTSVGRPLALVLLILGVLAGVRLGQLPGLVPYLPPWLSGVDPAGAAAEIEPVVEVPAATPSAPPPIETAAPSATILAAPSSPSPPAAGGGSGRGAPGSRVAAPPRAPRTAAPQQPVVAAPPKPAPSAAPATSKPSVVWLGDPELRSE